MRVALLVALILPLAGCGQSDLPVRLHPAEEAPDRLSDWAVVWSDGDYFEFNDAVLRYELNTPLFSDYALKLRGVWMPEGKAALYDAEHEFDFPVGTILSKTFHYEKAEGWSDTTPLVLRYDGEARLDNDDRLSLDEFVLVETRLLVRYEDGWRAFPYVWNAAQNEAWLEVAGDVRNIAFADSEDDTSFLYVVPDVNQCAACHAPDHTDAKIRPIGLKARHLNRAVGNGQSDINQIEQWQRDGVLSGVSDPIPTSTQWSEPGGASLDERARAYLDINCAHCHNSAGAADTSGLHLNVDAPMDRNFGICKSPTAVGQGSGDRPYDIVPGQPDDSILVFRMDHTDPAIAMPELGRSTVHTEGVALIVEWIASLDGDC